jgi:hypothetical protein
MREAAREDIWKTYMATITHSIAALYAKVNGGEYPMPTYYELTHPDASEDDTRTGAEIVDDLISRLKGGKNAESV